MNKLQNTLGNTDIYLIDQILKGRYQTGEKILDAGCGSGRNSKWFCDNDFELYAIDQSAEAVQEYIAAYPRVASQTIVGSLDQLPYEREFFDHIICSAVLHFAKSTADFKNMMAELARVLRPGGSLFFRMTTIVGVEDTAQAIGDGVYYLKDDTHRFLLTRELLTEVFEQNKLALAGSFKTTVVEDLRSMGTVVGVKTSSNELG